MAEKQTGVSLRLTDFVAGGGFLDDADVEVVEAKFELSDYGGRVSETNLAVVISYKDEEGEVHEQIYSAGDKKHFLPSEDDGGRSVIAVGTKTQLNNTTNFYDFSKNLVNAGFPESEMGENLDFLIGVKGHVVRVPQRKRTGLVLQTSESGEATSDNRTLLVFDQITGGFPGESKPKSKSKSGQKAAKVAKEINAAIDGVDEKATSLVVQILSENDGETPKAALLQGILKLTVKDNDKVQILKRVASVEFLEAGPWEFEDGVLSLS